MVMSPFEKFASPQPIGPSPAPVFKPTRVAKPKIVSKFTADTKGAEIPETPVEPMEDSYDQMVADLVDEYRGLFQWQSQWRRY